MEENNDTQYAPELYEKQKKSWSEAVTLDEVTAKAQAAFGITYLYPWQRIVIANIVDSFSYTQEEKLAQEQDDSLCDDKSFYTGRQIVLLPTGAGKSLCFLTPALILDGPTLVIYPLLALIADQKRRIDQGGLGCVVFKGGQTEAERNENFQKLRDGAKMILANPEVLQDKNLVKKLSKCNIRHLAIDEAHCVSEWGDTFRPAYLTLGNIIKELDIPAVTAFTATASPKVLERISEILFEGRAHLVRSDSDRPNLKYNVINCYSKKKAALKLALEKEKPLIIFCGTRGKAEDMARELLPLMGSDRVKFYHAGLEKEEKKEIEQWFFDKSDSILCTTCAYGMGVDKSNIRTVIHLEISPTVESYIQEVGRAARDGGIGTGYMLYSHSDSEKLASFPENSRERLMKGYAESSTCRRQFLLDALGGEETMCSGCDICDRKDIAPFAEDARYVLDLVKKNRFRFTIESLSQFLMEKFNQNFLEKKNCNPKDTDCNIYSIQDVQEIIFQLLHQNLIKKSMWPWKNRLTVI